MLPDDDQAMVLPCASVMVIIVLLKLALTCATPEVMFLRSRRRGFARVVCSSAILNWLRDQGTRSGCGTARDVVPVKHLVQHQVAFFLPAIGRALPLRVRALVWVRCPLTGSPRRWRSPR